LGSSDVVEIMSSRIRSTVSLAASAAAVLGVALTGCGRGPVEPIAPSIANSVTIELFVAGQITPSEGDYIIALNDDLATGSNVNSASGEQPGEPTNTQAYGLNPPPFTNWDQAFVFGSNPSGLPNCPLAPPNGFSYCWKAVATSGGQNTISFIPIILSPNAFTFIPQGNSGTGSGNAMEITLPINCMSINGSQSSGNRTCGPNGTVLQNVTQLYVNLVTIDNSLNAQDQIACLAGQSITIDLSTSSTTQLTKPTGPGCAGSANQNLLITGGLVIVKVPAP
jgi:hypothetical protein